MYNLFTTKSPPPEKNNNDFFIFLFLFFCFIFTINSKKIKANLNKIIGLESVKEEINYYMDFIKNEKNMKNGKLKYQKESF